MNEPQIKKNRECGTLVPWGTRDPCLICPIERGSMVKCDTCKSWSKNRRI